MTKELFVCSFGYRFLESQCRQGFRGVDICRYANFFPAFCIGSTRCLGLAGVLNSITAKQQMCRQTIAGGKTKDYLRDFGRIAVLSAPQRLKRLDHGPYGWLVVREKRGNVSVCTSAPVCSHSPGSSAHTRTPKDTTSCARDSVNPPTAHLAAW